MCHDEDLADDFLPMVEGSELKLEDPWIANLAAEASQSDPQHSPMGYPIQPVFSKRLSQILVSEQLV